VIELEYDEVDNKAVLFNCHWFDITNVVRVDHRYGFIEVKHTFTLRSGEPFVSACQVNQVYYLSYASKKKEMPMMNCNESEMKEMDVNSDFFFKRNKPTALYQFLLDKISIRIV
jgi:Domain of unknown function (DUF4216)